MKASVFLAGPVRTAIGQFNGGLAETSAADLGSAVLRESLERASAPPESVDEVIMGNVISAGQGQNIARQVAMHGGLANTVNATTVNKVCGSGMKSVMLATQAIRCGDASMIVAGGTENMSMAPYVLQRAREGYHLGHGQVVDTLIRDGLWDIYQDSHMGKLADQCSVECEFTRQQLDDYAVSSYQRAIASQENGFFAREIVPVEAKAGRKTKTISVDEEPSRFNEEKLRSLKPAFNPDGCTTAGNASSINDGASALTVISKERAEELGVQPAARVISYCSSALEPERFTLAPLGAIKHALEIAELSADDIDVFEINEAFSLVPLAAMRELGIAREKINPFGGAVALGHPIGTSGARILVTLINGLVERNARYGLASLCIGGGEAVAMVVERI